MTVVPTTDHADLMLTQPPAQAIAPIPDPAEFRAILNMVDIVSRSGIVPAAYRTTFTPSGELREDKRPNCVVAALMGRTFGWDLLTAMRNIHVIEGAASLKPEAQLGMIRARGHKVKIVRHDRHVVVTGTRADTGDELTASFSFDDGVRAGLCTIGDNGMPRARSERGKVLPWEQYPVDMCQWRAVAVICRGLFPDVVLGLGYTPEELGAIVEADGSVTIETAPMPTDNTPPTGQPEQEAASSPREAAAPASSTSPTSVPEPAPQQAQERTDDVPAGVDPTTGEVTDEQPAQPPQQNQAQPGTTEPWSDQLGEVDIIPEILTAADEEELRTMHRLASRNGLLDHDARQWLTEPDIRRLLPDGDQGGPLPIGGVIFAARNYLMRTGAPVRGQRQ